MGNIVQLNEGEIKNQLGEMVVQLGEMVVRLVGL